MECNLYLQKAGSDMLFLGGFSKKLLLARQWGTQECFSKIQMDILFSMLVLWNSFETTFYLDFLLSLLLSDPLFYHHSELSTLGV